MYPPGFGTRIVRAGPAPRFVESSGPHFFAGVATVVAKLLIQCAPDVALFGEKDYQQLKVVTRLARDLDLPVEIIGVPTVREQDGLAMSSRNGYLSASERAAAPALYRVLKECAGKLADGGCRRGCSTRAASKSSAPASPSTISRRAMPTRSSPSPRRQDGPVRLLVAARASARRA